MTECNLCPRACNRENITGYCGKDKDIRIARAALHFWEEPCISGEKGSGTVFFTGCPLRCIYCQNHEIALGNVGYKVSISKLSDIFLNLQNDGANNINLVTPTHYIDEIKEALILAKNKGLSIPIVYNTGSYERVDALKKLEGLIDVYLPDYKYADSDLAKKFSNAEDYPEVAILAIKEMLRQVGETEFEVDITQKKYNSALLNESAVNESADFPNGIPMIKKGVIVRHLALPGQTENSKACIKRLYDTFGDSIYISIMNQYTPIRSFPKYPELNRRLKDDEYEKIVDYAIDLGVENGFIQEGETAEDSFIPDFMGESPDI